MLYELSVLFGLACDTTFVYAIRTRTQGHRRDFMVLEFDEDPNLVLAIWTGIEQSSPLAAHCDRPLRRLFDISIHMW